MIDINLNLYRIFYIVAQSKSFSDASNKLSISTTAVSKNINQLEDLLDTKLFHRESKGVRLTAEGNEFFKYIDECFTSLDIGEKLLLQKNDFSTGQIVIGCPSHIATFYLMDYIEKVKQDYPNLKVKIVSGANAEELIGLLEAHKIDFIIDSTYMEILYNNIIVEEIKKIPNILISKIPKEIDNIKELEEFKYILPYEYTYTTKKLIDCLKQHDTSIKANTEIDITELRINAVKRGIGIGYVMKDAVKEELEKEEVYEVKIPIELPYSTLKLIYLDGQLTKVDKEFIKKYLNK